MRSSSTFFTNAAHPICHFPLIEEYHQWRAVHDWNNTTTPFPSNHTISELFERQVHVSPEATALVMDGHSITYSDLNKTANKLARFLQKQYGVNPGSIVAISMERSFTMIIGLLAILKLGGAYLPFDRLCPHKRICAMLHDAGVSVVITDGELALHGYHVIYFDRFHNETPQLDHESKENLPCFTKPDGIAYVNYTSGSTGTPKGVAISHKAVISLLFEANYTRLDNTRRILQLAPPSFDAFTFELWGGLLHGGCSVLFNGKIPTLLKLRETIRNERVTTIFLTTALFNTIIDEAPDTLASIEAILTGGETHSISHIRRAKELLPQALISSVYGPTESTTFSTHFPISALKDNAKTVPLGRPINNRQVFILKEDKTICPVGEVGEIYIAGPGLALRYLRKPDLTAQKFVTNLPFLKTHQVAYRTGDLGCYQESGIIEFVGRDDDQIKLRGFRIELSEVEQELIKHPKVKQAVVRIQNQRNGKTMEAFVVAPSNVVPDLPAFLGEYLPSYMLPTRYFALEFFPLTTNGKIDYAQLMSISKNYKLTANNPVQRYQ